MGKPLVAVMMFRRLLKVRRARVGVGRLRCDAATVGRMTGLLEDEAGQILAMRGILLNTISIVKATLTETVLKN